MSLFHIVHLKEIIRSVALRLGFELVRRPVKGRQPLPLAEGPAGSLLSGSNAGAYPFNVPVERLSWDNGFSLHPDGWNPYVQTVRAYLAGECDSYAGSPLEAFYRSFRPDTAAAYLGPAFSADSPLHTIPAQAYILPWSLLSPEQRLRQRRRFNREEEQLSGGLGGLGAGGAGAKAGAQHGVNKMGPISPAKGQVEFRRLTSLADSIRQKGYRRELVKDIEVAVLQHKDEWLYVTASGFHRAAVLAALGFEQIPVLPKPPLIINSDVLAGAPALRGGFWTADDLQLYFDFLYAERGRRRAGALGLL